MTVRDYSVYPNQFSSISSLPMDFQSKLTEPMFAILLFLLSLSLLSLALLTLSLYRRVMEEKPSSSSFSSSSIVKSSLARTVEKTLDSKLTNLAHSILLEILSSNSPKWIAPLIHEVPECMVSEGSLVDQVKVDSSSEECDKKKKKKKKGKGKKKRPISPEEKLKLKEKTEFICSYPFTSSSSAIQKKIKQEYVQLVKSNEGEGLTLAQVGKFVNCLIESRNELQIRSDTIQRRFTIAKALLHKADRSCFDRLHQQIYKIELEQKRLEEDASVYNWIQQQLKLSPAYKQLLEITAGMELEAPKSSRKPEELEQIADADFGDISFEELLAQEKKDSFWQKQRKSSP